jgi:hypothetical protein
MMILEIHLSVNDTEDIDGGLPSACPRAPRDMMEEDDFPPIPSHL